MTINLLLTREQGHSVGLDSLMPCYRIVRLLTVQQIAYLASLEAQVSDVIFRTADFLVTVLVVGTQVRTIRKHAVTRSVTAYVAHDMAIVFHAIVLSHDGVLVAVAGFDARSVSLLAHQGTHHDPRHVTVVYCAAFGIAVAQYALTRQFSSKRAHSFDGGFSLELTVLNAEVFNDTADVVEESHRFALIVQHLNILDDMTVAVVVSFETVDSGSYGHHQRVLQVDVGSLPYIEIASLHNTDGVDESLQIRRGSYLIWILLRAFA